MPTKRSARWLEAAAELHRVRHRLAAIVETRPDRILEDGRQIGEHVVAEIAPRDVRAQRQRQARLQEPPLAEVEHLFQALVRVRELALVDDEADVRVACPSPRRESCRTAPRGSGSRRSPCAGRGTPSSCDPGRRSRGRPGRPAPAALAPRRSGRSRRRSRRLAAARTGPGRTGKRAARWRWSPAAPRAPTRSASGCRAGHARTRSRAFRRDLSEPQNMKASSASGLWWGSAWAADPSSLRASRAHQGGLALLQLVQEAPLELGKDLLARERRHLDVDAFLSSTRTSSSSASFAWSSASSSSYPENHVVGLRLVRRPVLGVDHGRRTTTRPHTTRSRGRPAQAHHHRRGPPQRARQSAWTARPRAWGKDTIAP